MNAFQKKEKELEKSRCKTCGGLGQCDDSWFGDISYNTWKCKDCNGTGLKQLIGEIKS